MNVEGVLPTIQWAQEEDSGDLHSLPSARSPKEGQLLLSKGKKSHSSLLSLCT